MEPINRLQGINSASLYEARRAGTIPAILTRFLAPIDCLKIPAQVSILINIHINMRNFLATHPVYEHMHARLFITRTGCAFIWQAMSVQEVAAAIVQDNDE